MLFKAKSNNNKKKNLVNKKVFLSKGNQTGWFIDYLPISLSLDAVLMV